MDQDTDLITDEVRSNWVRLRTLTALRWIAIAGQLASIVVASSGFDIEINLGGFALVIGASVVLNIISSAIYPENTRLSERGATFMLLFDISQLSALLFFSGGLHNPFALLILAPVSIASSALRPSSAIMIGAATIALISLVAMFHLPLVTHAGEEIVMPQMILFGNWAAIVIGVVFIGVFSWRVTSEIHTMSEALLATQQALSREQKLTDLGGVVAAAAHELGTPLATIKLVSSEMVDELSDAPELREDAELIRDQANRCRDILQSMGRAGKDDLHLRTAPLQAVIEEAAEPHMARGKTVLIDMLNNGQGDGRGDGQPHVYRHPEVIHGLRNLVQNAVDFAETTVWVDVWWDAASVSLRIIDDGAGFPPSVIGRIGDPFVRRRRADTDASRRPGYKGMGLGLFIAKTLLERTGAEISFANGSDRFDLHLHAGRRSGAIVEVLWPREKICISKEEQNRALGENRQFNL